MNLTSMSSSWPYSCISFKVAFKQRRAGSTTPIAWDQVRLECDSISFPAVTNMLGVMADAWIDDVRRLKKADCCFNSLAERTDSGEYVDNCWRKVGNMSLKIWICTYWQRLGHNTNLNVSVVNPYESITVHVLIDSMYSWDESLSGNRTEGWTTM